MEMEMLHFNSELNQRESTIWKIEERAALEFRPNSKKEGGATTEFRTQITATKN